jgi:hypothetical protein
MIRRILIVLGICAGVVATNAGLAFATASADVSGSETTNGVTSVNRTDTVQVSGTATNNGPDAVTLTSNWHVSGGTIVANSTSQGACTAVTSGEHCTSGVKNLSGQSVQNSITVQPTTDTTKSTISITFTAGPQTTDPNTANNKQVISVKITKHPSITLPVRGTFFYPWYPQTWPNPAPHFTPTLGAPYNQDDPAVVTNQVNAMNYAHFHLAISSWWGQGHYTDQRLQSYMNAAHGTPLHFAPYYEAEGNTTAATPGSPNPPASQITSDLNYIASKYINDPNYAWVSGKPLIFVYSDGTDGCEMATRWAQANAAATTHFYVVLKVFGGYASCADQPNGWHQYAPASAEHPEGNAFVISPGFWKYNEATPRLARDITRWKTNVNDMNCSTAAFKLVTTFNEWGEGTAIEDAAQWQSQTGYGQYLDALHYQTTCK